MRRGLFPAATAAGQRYDFFAENKSCGVVPGRDARLTGRPGSTEYRRTDAPRRSVAPADRPYPDRPIGTVAPTERSHSGSTEYRRTDAPRRSVAPADRPYPDRPIGTVAPTERSHSGSTEYRRTDAPRRSVAPADRPYPDRPIGTVAPRNGRARQHGVSPTGCASAERRPDRSTALRQTNRHSRTHGTVALRQHGVSPTRMRPGGADVRGG